MNIKDNGLEIIAVSQLYGTSCVYHSRARLSLFLTSVWNCFYFSLFNVCARLDAFFHSHARLGMFLWCRGHSNEWQGWSCNRSSPWRLSTTSSRLQTTFCWLPCMLWRVCSLPFASLILLTLFIHHIFLLFYSRLKTPCCFTSCFFTINSFSFSTAFLHWDLDKIFCVSRLWILFSQYFSLWWIKLTTLLSLQYWAIVSTEWWGVCLDRGADCLHMVQLMPLSSQNPIISCLMLIQTGFTFLFPAYPGCPGKKAVKRTGVVVAAAAAVVSTGWTCYIAWTTRHCAFTFRKCLYDC